MIELLIATALVAVGFTIGYHFRILDKRAAEFDPTPRCQCKHIYTTHKKGYSCQAQDVVDRNGHVDKYRNCPCTIYLGPDPLVSGLWSPPIEK